MEQFCRAMNYLFRVDEFELHVSSRPDNQVCVGRIVQQCEQELPELQGATALVRQTLLLHFTCLQGQTGHNECGSIPFPIFIPNPSFSPEQSVKSLSVNSATPLQKPNKSSAIIFLNRRNPIFTIWRLRLLRKCDDGRTWQSQCHLPFIYIDGKKIKHGRSQFVHPIKTEHCFITFIS